MVPRIICTQVLDHISFMNSRVVVKVIRTLPLKTLQNALFINFGDFSLGLWVLHFYLIWVV